MIKESGLNAAEVGSYRPISNLSVISKLLERLVAKQLTDYLNTADLLPWFQSGFRTGHSTETAILRVLSDILAAVDGGNVAALVLLDLSAAFDTVDHDILCRRLQMSFSLSGAVLSLQSVSVCPLWSVEVRRHCAYVWSPAGVSVRPDPIYFIHG